MLEDSGSDRYFYNSRQMLKSPKLMIKYEKDQDSEEIASLTSGKEMKSYDGNF